MGLVLIFVFHDQSRHLSCISLVLFLVKENVVFCLLKVILKEDVLDLGKQGQLLDVKAGFFRNFLLPTGKAQLMTPLLLK